MYFPKAEAELALTILSSDQWYLCNNRNPSGGELVQDEDGKMFRLEISRELSKYPKMSPCGNKVWHYDITNWQFIPWWPHEPAGYGLMDRRKAIASWLELALQDYEEWDEESPQVILDDCLVNPRRLIKIAEDVYNGRYPWGRNYANIRVGATLLAASEWERPVTEGEFLKFTWYGNWTKGRFVSWEIDLNIDDPAIVEWNTATGRPSTFMESYIEII